MHSLAGTGASSQADPQAIYNSHQIREAEGRERSVADNKMDALVIKQWRSASTFVIVGYHE